MDLVLNVMLGNSPTPQPGAPGGKIAGAGFASLLPFLESMDGAIADQSVDTKPQAGGKNVRPATDARKSSDPTLMAALNLPIVVPQTVPQAPPPVSTEMAAPSVDTKQSSVKELTAVPKDFSKFLTPAALPGPVAAKLTADHTPFQSKTKVQTEIPQPQVQDQDKKIAAAPPSADVLPVNTQSVPAQASIPAPEKPAEPTTAKTDNKPQNMATLKKAAASAADPAPVAESLTASAVKVALKQTLPAQSKISATLASSKLPTARAFAATQSTTDVHPAQAHATGQPHESQPARDQPKKQEDNAPVSPQGTADNQPNGQVNAVSRVVSSELNGESPKQAPTTANSVPASIKQDVSSPEPPVLPNSAVALQSARLLQNLGQSELRVGMKMGDLGNVEIRTQLRHDQLHAEISVERGDLSHTLAAELPALQQRLREHDLPAASIVVNHQAPAGSGGFERGPQQQQQTTTPMSYAFGIDPVTSSSSPEETRIADSALDVHI